MIAFQARLLPAWCAAALACGSLAAQAQQPASSPVAAESPAMLQQPAQSSIGEISDVLPPADGSSGGSTASGPWKLSRPPMPFEIVRSLQFLQDQVARGNDSAIRVQARLLRRFGPVFLNASPELWADQRNLRAAALFVLSGGPPEVLRGILAQRVGAEHRPLLEGALAYVENRTAAARENLAQIDLDALEPGLAAHVSLVLAQLEQSLDPARAIVHLDRARLLAPGGLIEEAALRLEVLLADELGERIKADHLARQYFDRFASSSYAANFQARFAAAYASRPAGEEGTAVSRMADLTAGLPESAKLSLFLAVGRRALVAGNLALATRAAEAALAQPGASASDRQRASLYAVASSLTDRSIGEATAMLDAIDASGLQPADAKLHEAAYSVLAEMQRPVAASGDPAQAPEGPATSPVIGRAQQLLNEVSNDLQKAQP